MTRIANFTPKTDTGMVEAIIATSTAANLKNFANHASRQEPTRTGMRPTYHILTSSACLDHNCDDA